VRAAVVGDNGQGKTTFLRTLVESLKPLAGEVKWGHGCKIGTYAQHVYSTLPEEFTVLEYLQSKGKGRKIQEVLEVAGALLFRGSHVDKKIKVLSGGERARVVLAGLLLSDYNVLILDEPGNHLDVDTVEALVEAMKEYAGTVIFTSHDRHFTGAVATCIVEVREGRVALYPGKYDDYVYRVNKEVEAGEREAATERAKLPPDVLKARAKRAARDADAIRADLERVEASIGELEATRGELEVRLGEPASDAELQRICDKLAETADALDAAEQKYAALQSELDAAG
jgi:ATP-binding cassette, subfamily F, member 3